MVPCFHVEIHTITAGRLGNNCYLLTDDGQSALIDSAIWESAQESIDAILKYTSSLDYVLLTHAHFDHAYFAQELAEYFGAETYLHKDEEPFVDMYMQGGLRWGFKPGSFRNPSHWIKDGEAIQLGSETISVIHTPGHTPGCVSFVAHTEKAVFTGDTLFRRGIGRTDLPGGDFNQINESIKNRLYTLPGDYVIYPGHGDPSTIEEEKMENPFVY